MPPPGQKSTTKQNKSRFSSYVYYTLRLLYVLPSYLLLKRIREEEEKRERGKEKKRTKRREEGKEERRKKKGTKKGKWNRKERLRGGLWGYRNNFKQLVCES